MINAIIQTYPKYRLAWKSTVSNESGCGSFLFDTPEQARDTRDALKQLFPFNVHWLEDKDGQRVEIPA